MPATMVQTKAVVLKDNGVDDVRIVVTPDGDAEIRQGEDYVFMTRDMVRVLADYFKSTADGQS
jgi:hypothetical protein